MSFTIPIQYDSSLAEAAETQAREAFRRIADNALTEGKKASASLGNAFKVISKDVSGVGRGMYAGMKNALSGMSEAAQKEVMEVRAVLKGLEKTDDVFSQIFRQEKMIKELKDRKFYVGALAKEYEKLTREQKEHDTSVAASNTKMKQQNIRRDALNKALLESTNRLAKVQGALKAYSGEVERAVVVGQKDLEIMRVKDTALVKQQKELELAAAKNRAFNADLDRQRVIEEESVASLKRLNKEFATLGIKTEENRKRVEMLTSEEYEQYEVSKLVADAHRKKARFLAESSNEVKELRAELDALTEAEKRAAAAAKQVKIGPTKASDAPLHTAGSAATIEAFKKQQQALEKLTAQVAVYDSAISKQSAKMKAQLAIWDAQAAALANQVKASSLATIANNSFNETLYKNTIAQKAALEIKQKAAAADIEQTKNLRLSEVALEKFSSTSYQAQRINEELLASKKKLIDLRVRDVALIVKNEQELRHLSSAMAEQAAKSQQLVDLKKREVAARAASSKAVMKESTKTLTAESVLKQSQAAQRAEVAYKSFNESLYRTRIESELLLKTSKDLIAVKAKQAAELRDLEIQHTKLTSAMQEEIEKQKILNKLAKEAAVIRAKNSTEVRSQTASLTKLSAQTGIATASSTKLGTATTRANKQLIRTGASMSGLGSSISMYTNGNLLAVTSIYAVARALREMVVSGAEFEQKMAFVGAIMGTTVDQMEAMDKKAVDLAASTQFMAVEVAGAFEELGRAGLGFGDAMEAIEPTLRLAAIGALDFSKTADIATNVMVGFNLTASDFAGVVDVMAQAVTSSNLNIAQLGNTLSYVAPIAASFGISLEFTTAMAEVLANSGLKASRAGTSLRMSMLKLFNPTKKGAAALREMGVEVNELADDMDEELFRVLVKMNEATEGATKNTHLLTELVGVRAVTGFTQLVKAVGSNVEILRKFKLELDLAAGAAKKMQERIEATVQVDFEKFLSAVDAIGKAAFKEIADDLSYFLKKWTLVFQAISKDEEAIRKVIQTLKDLGEIILYLVSLTVVGKLGFGIIGLGKNVVGATSKLRSMTKAMKATSAASKTATGTAGKYRNVLKATGDDLTATTARTKTFKNVLSNLKGELIGAELATKGWGSAIKALEIGGLVYAGSKIVEMYQAVATEAEEARRQIEETNDTQLYSSLDPRDQALFDPTTDFDKLAALRVKEARDELEIQEDQRDVLQQKLDKLTAMEGAQEVWGAEIKKTVTLLEKSDMLLGILNRNLEKIRGATAVSQLNAYDAAISVLETRTVAVEKRLIESAENRENFNNAMSSDPLDPMNIAQMELNAYDKSGLKEAYAGQLKRMDELRKKKIEYMETNAKEVKQGTKLIENANKQKTAAEEIAEMNERLAFTERERIAAVDEGLTSDEKKLSNLKDQELQDLSSLEVIHKQMEASEQLGIKSKEYQSDLRSAKVLEEAIHQNREDQVPLEISLINGRKDLTEETKQYATELENVSLATVGLFVEMEDLASLTTFNSSLEKERSNILGGLATKMGEGGISAKNAAVQYKQLTAEGGRLNAIEKALGVSRPKLIALNKQLIITGKATQLTYKLEAAEISTLAAKYNEAIAGAQKYMLARAELNSLVDKGAITHEQHVKALDKERLAYKKTLGPLQAYSASLEESIGTLEGFAVDTMDDFRDSLVDAFVDGEFAMSDFVDSAKRKLAEIAINKIYVSIIGNISTTGVAGVVGAASDAIAGDSGGSGGLFSAGGLSNLTKLFGGNSIGEGLASFFYGDAALSAVGTGSAAMDAAAGSALSASQSSAAAASNLASTSNLMLGVGSILGYLAGNLIFEGGYSSIGSGGGAMAGAAYGASVGGPWGAVIGGILGGIAGGGVGSLFGQENEPDPKAIIGVTGGQFSLDWYQDLEEEQVTAIQTAMGQLNEVLVNVGEFLGEEAVEALSNVNFSQAITADITADWLEKIFTDNIRLMAGSIGDGVGDVLVHMLDLVENDVEQFTNDLSVIMPVADALQDTEMGDLFGLFSDKLKDNMFTLVNLAQDFAKEEETMGETITRMVTSTLVFSTAIALTGRTMDEISLVHIVRLGDALVELAESSEELTSQMSFYYQNFFSDTERQAAQVSAANDIIARGMADLGVVIPKTRFEFRNFVESIDLGTDSGRRLFVEMMNLASAFDIVFDAGEQVGEVSTDIADFIASLKPENLEFGDDLNAMQSLFAEWGLTLPLTSEGLHDLIQAGALTEQQIRRLIDNADKLTNAWKFLEQELGDVLKDLSADRIAALERDSEARIDAIEAEGEAQIDALNEELSELKSSLSTFKSIVTSITSALDTLETQTLGIDELRQKRLEEAAAAIEQIRGGGEAPDNINDIIRDLSSVDARDFATREEWLAAIEENERRLRELREAAGDAQTDVERQIDLLEAQIEAVNEQTDALIEAEEARLDELIAFEDEALTNILESLDRFRLDSSPAALAAALAVEVDRLLAGLVTALYQWRPPEDIFPGSVPVGGTQVPGLSTETRLTPQDRARMQREETQTFRAADQSRDSIKHSTNVELSSTVASLEFELSMLREKIMEGNTTNVAMHKIVKRWDGEGLPADRDDYAKTVAEAV